MIMVSLLCFKDNSVFFSRTARPAPDTNIHHISRNINGLQFGCNSAILFSTQSDLDVPMVVRDGTSRFITVINMYL